MRVRPIFCDFNRLMVDAMIDAPPGTTPLKVKNYLNWCSVSVDGGAFTTMTPQTVNVTPGVITLVAKRAGTFIVDGNMWHHTDGDSGNGETGTIQFPRTRIKRRAQLT